MSLSYFFDLFTTIGAVIFIIITATLFIISYSKNEKTLKIKNFFVKYSKWLILGASFAAIVGSLIYSEIFKFEPCVLCWWQRIFIYPVFFISLVSIINKDKNPFQYINPLMWIALAISLYHNYLITVAGKKDAFLCVFGNLKKCKKKCPGQFSVETSNESTSTGVPWLRPVRCAQARRLVSLALAPEIARALRPPPPHLDDPSPLPLPCSAPLGPFGTCWLPRLGPPR
jgi:disulfide bond formation protein DsbB